MKNITKTLAILIPLLFVGCGSDSDSSISSEKSIKGEIVVDFSASRMKKLLIDEGAITEDRVVFGYRAYKIPYITTDEEGLDVNASGLFVIPTGMPSTINKIGLSMVSDSHGTIFKNAKAPTVHGEIYGTPDGSPILLTSIGGFATLQADYIGFGDSKNHYHPYMLKESSANATVDFIKQVKIFAKENNIKLNQQLFLTGYSEGGYVTMATLKKIEEEGMDLSVSMAVPMASATYSLTRVSNIMLNQEKMVLPAMVADLAYAHSIAYSEDVCSIVNEPYASKLSTLFDGTHSMTDINSQLPTDIKGKNGLFKDEAIADYLANDSHWYRIAMAENSVDAWTPQTALRFINCEGDKVAPFSESNMTFETMKSMGAEDIEIIPLEKRLGLSKNLGHMECALPSYKMVAEMFANIRKETIGY